MTKKNWRTNMASISIQINMGIFFFFFCSGLCDGWGEGLYWGEAGNVLGDTVAVSPEESGLRDGGPVHPNTGARPARAPSMACRNCWLVLPW